MSTLRRRLIREGIRNKNKVIFSKDVDYLIKNYKIYMKAQNAKILKDKFIEIKNLLKNLVNNNKLLVQISLLVSFYLSNSILMLILYLNSKYIRD